MPTPASTMTEAQSEKGAGGAHSPFKLPAALVPNLGRQRVRARRYRAPMAQHHRFRFGVQASAPMSGKEWAELARRVEDLGYSTLTMPDHFGNQMAPMPALMAAAAATTTLRVGALVWDNDYKHPVVLAKELATMDLLSDGRLEVGIGAGWERADYDWSGIPYDPPGVRVDRFEEGLAVIKGHFGPGPFSFSGQHYTITRARRAPEAGAAARADPHRRRRQAGAVDRGPRGRHRRHQRVTGGRGDRPRGARVDDTRRGRREGRDREARRRPTLRVTSR